MWPCSKVKGSDVQFERKPVDHDFVTKEMWPLLERHWREISAFQDIPLKPDIEKYVAMEQAGNLRCFTVRVDDALIGYAVFFVHMNLHYSTSLQAVQDVLYLEKSSRGAGVGREFISWCDDQLKAESVQVVYHHVKEKLNFGPLLQGLGYKRIEALWARRLDVI